MKAFCQPAERLITEYEEENFVISSFFCDEGRAFSPPATENTFMLYHHHVFQDCVTFVTTVTRNRTPIFTDPACAREAVDVLYRVQELHPFLLHGFVIMPDHCHFLLTPSEYVPLSLIMRSYKVSVVWGIGKGALWQSRFDARQPTDSWKILNYIHANPVKAGLVSVPEEYPWSSASGKWEVTPLEG